MSRSPSLYVVAKIELVSGISPEFRDEIMDIGEYEGFSVGWEDVHYECFGEEIAEENTLVLWEYVTGGWGFFEIEKIQDAIDKLKKFVDDRFAGYENSVHCSVSYS